MKFAAVKALAISNLLDLEKQGKITREDGFQGILNAIAGDVRSKHRKRLQRQQEMESMNDALRHLAERKKYFEEQINSYNDYIEAGMSTMQRGKGFVFLYHYLCCLIIQSQEKTICTSFHQAIFPSSRSPEIRPKPEIWLLPLHS